MTFDDLLIIVREFAYNCKGHMASDYESSLKIDLKEDFFSLFYF